MLHAIDADTHLFASTQVWDFIDEEMYPCRPIIVSGPGGTVYRRSSFWLIDGNIFPKSAGKGGGLLGTPTEPGQRETTPDVRARELLDIPGRLQAMDLMGVATQETNGRKSLCGAALSGSSSSSLSAWRR
jgi:hypothetical protein